MAVFDRRLDEARDLINELSAMIDADRLSITSSITSSVVPYATARL